MLVLLENSEGLHLGGGIFANQPRQSTLRSLFGGRPLTAHSRLTRRFSEDQIAGARRGKKVYLGELCSRMFVMPLHPDVLLPDLRPASHS